MRLLLIDAPNVLRRVFEAQAGGDDTTVVEHSVSGSLSILQRCCRELDATHALTVFDGAGRSWRHELYPDYKANRPPTPTLVPPALSAFDRRLRDDGYATASVDRMEADDVIASVVRHLAQHAIETTIVSSDQGYAQLLGDHVTIYHHPTHALRDRAWLQQRLGVSPELYPVLQALAGNASDNYPGIPGIGPKRAAELLQHHGDAESLLQASTQPGADRLLAKLSGHREQLRLYLQLATLRDDIQLGLNLQNLRLPPAGDARQP